jgi:hypothetical protein
MLLKSNSFSTIAIVEVRNNRREFLGEGVPQTARGEIMNLIDYTMLVHIK